MSSEQPKNRNLPKQSYFLQARGIFRQILRYPKLLLGVVFIGLILAAYPIYKRINNSQPPTPPSIYIEGYKVRVDIGKTANYGNDLSIEVVRITEISPSQYKVDASVTYKKTQTATFRNAKVGSLLTFPEENGYNIQVFTIESERAIFIVKAP